jgi:hypothetical protein
LPVQFHSSFSDGHVYPVDLEAGVSRSKMDTGNPRFASLVITRGVDMFD